MNGKLFLFSIKNAFRRKSILTIALIGTGLGTALMATLVSLSNGMDAELTRTMNSVASEITVTAGDSDSMVAMFGGGTPTPISYGDEMESIEYVKSVQPSVIGTLPGDVFQAGRSIGPMGVPIVGLDLIIDQQVDGRTTKIIEGRTIENQYELLVGKGVFQGPQEADELQVGDTLEIPILSNYEVDENAATDAFAPSLPIGNFGAPSGESPEKYPTQTSKVMETITFTVVGIYETGNSFDDNAFVGAIDDIREVIDMDDDEVTLFVVSADDTQNVESVAADIETMFEDRTLPVTATMAKDILGDLNDALDIFRSFILVISLVAAVAGGMSIFIIMLMSVIERLQEFGIFKATGWSNFNIVITVIIESITVALMGSAVGLTVGYIVGKALDQQLGADIALFDLQLVAMIMSFGIVMGVLGGVLPAIKAARVSPIETLQSI